MINENTQLALTWWLVWTQKITQISIYASLSLSTVFTYLWINQNAFWILCLLMFLDLFTGALKWIMFKDLASNSFYTWLIKKLWILILLIGSALALKWLNILNEDWTFLSSFLLWLWEFASMWILSLSIFAEFYSMVWNIWELITREKSKEADIWIMIIKWIKDLVKETELMQIIIIYLSSC